MFICLFTDGIMGEVVFWTLKKCLGHEFDEKTHFVWVKIFSRILKNMVPVAVAYELETKSVNQKARMDTFSLFHRQDPSTFRSPGLGCLGDTKSAGSCQFDDLEVEEKVIELERKYSRPVHYPIPNLFDKGS